MRDHFRRLRYVMGENPITLFAFSLFFLLIVLGAFGPYLIPYDPLASNTAIALKPPSWSHWFGTDDLGRDVFSRVVAATRLDLAISVSAVSLSFLAGSLAGACAGYFGGATDRLVGRLTDTIMAFPLFVLAMGIVSALGNTVGNIVYATAIINFPFYARVARAEANARREATDPVGEGRGWLIFRLRLTLVVLLPTYPMIPHITKSVYHLPSEMSADEEAVGAATQNRSVVAVSRESGDR